MNERLHGFDFMPHPSQHIVSPAPKHSSHVCGDVQLLSVLFPVALNFSFMTFVLGVSFHARASIYRVG